MAFQDKGEDQEKWVNTADYEDEWLPLTSNVKLRHWWLCSANNGCRVACPSKLWVMEPGTDETNCKKWYCPCCEAKYKSSGGVLVEFSTGEPTSLWMFAKVPEDDHKDAKAMRLEGELRKLKRNLTTKDFFNTIGDIQPCSREGVLEPVARWEFSVQALTAYEDTRLTSSVFRVRKGFAPQNVRQIEKWKWDWILSGDFLKHLDN